MQGKIAITNPDLGYTYEQEIAYLKSLGFDAEFLPLECINDRKIIIDTLKNCQFVLAGPQPYDAEVMDGIKTLKVIARLGVGMDNIDIDAATQRGIAVCSSPGSNAESVAQHVVSFMLDLSLRITRYDKEFRQGIIQRRYSNDLIGKTVGLVGFGNVARIVAKLISGFDTHILTFDPNQDEEAAKSLKASYVDLETLIKESDYISMHVPYNKHTAGIANKEFFNKMKNTAYFINTSRAGIVLEEDLIFALENNMIAGAAIDVYEKLPLDINHRLFKLNNTVLTPYVAYSSEKGTQGMVKMAIQSVLDYCNGKEMINLLNPHYKDFIAKD